MNIILRLIACSIFAAVSAFELYQRGRVDAARAAFRAELERAALAKDQRSLWQAYMSLAWFEDEVSEHRNAIEHSNKALEIAVEIRDPFMLGRSLCWLGWAYSGLGMYDAARSFYTNAVEIGAPNGEIAHPNVWGLATQELGAIAFKTGDTKEAKRLLESAYKYAQQHGIDTGVAEGGAHLGEIALAEGKYAEAEKYAKRAIDGAKRCNCSPYNLTRAQVVGAKAELERSRFEPGRIVKVRETLDTLLAECEKMQHKRCIAETKLMISKTLPPEQFEERSALVQSAFETLATAESELRGLAEAEVGRVFLESENTALAEFYLKNGLKVDAEMLRKVDKAYVTLALADVSGKLEKEQEKAEQLLEALKAAKKSGALPLVLESQMKLIEILEANGYHRAAYEQTNDAIKIADKLIKKNPEKSWERKHFSNVRLELSAQALRLGLEMQREPAPPQ